MDFPSPELMDEEACYERLVEILHPEGRACPRCQSRQGFRVHRRTRAPVLDYHCSCGRVCNAFPQTVFRKTHRRPSEILLILRGIAPGTTRARLAHALNRHRQHLLHLRHPLQDPARQAADPLPLDDPVVEADERFQNAGEKRPPAHRPRRSAAATGQPATGPRQQGPRSAAGRRGGRTRFRGTPTSGRGALGPGHAPGVRATDDLAAGDGLQRRGGRL
jgi:hypothetical protein